jgi:exopolysaccharide biosynthesis polyprenyl glycosylphosphotransferase
MISQRARGLQSICLFFQLVLSGLAFWGASFLLWKIYPPGLFEPGSYVVYFLILEGSLLIPAAISGFRQVASPGQTFPESLTTTLRQWLVAAGMMALYLVAVKDQTISRVFLFSFLAVLYLLLLLTNHLLPEFLVSQLFLGVRGEPTFLVGPGVRLPGFKEWLDRKSSLGYEILGLISDEATPAGPVHGYPVLGGLDDLERLLVERQVKHLIVLEFPAFREVLRYLADLCERRALRLLVVTDFQDLFRHSVTLVEDEGLRFLTLRSEPLENPFNLALKRALDLTVSIPVIILILPWTTLLVWLLQRLQSPGPVFYRQPRTGLHRQEFQIFKYRTMRVDNPDVARQATADDDRIYPAGRWFRKTSLDELPQFLNVLQGEMSVVGPRPHLLRHDEAFARSLANYHVRSLVKPGITGLAQVRGFRGETKDERDIAGRVNSDIEYLENWSLGLDLAIILRTVWQIIRPPKTAY